MSPNLTEPMCHQERRTRWGLKTHYGIQHRVDPWPSWQEQMWGVGGRGRSRAEAVSKNAATDKRLLSLSRILKVCIGLGKFQQRKNIAGVMWPWGGLREWPSLRAGTVHNTSMKHGRQIAWGSWAFLPLFLRETGGNSISRDWTKWLLALFYHFSRAPVTSINQEYSQVVG